MNRKRIEKLEEKIDAQSAWSCPDEWLDVVAFLESEYFIPTDDTPDRRKLITLEPHQKAILRHAFSKTEDGRFPYSTIIWSAPKKSGKTEIASGINLWMAMTQGSHLEMFACANDLDQSKGRVFAGVVRAIEMNPRLSPYCKVTQNMITFPNGNTITALANDYAGAAGAQRLFLSTWDELWAYTTESARRLYEELTPIPTLKNSLRFITSYAGFENESELLWDLYRKIVQQGERVPPEELDGMDLPVFRNGSMLAYWDSLETADEACRRMPWQQGDRGKQYYEDQAADLRPNAFRRLHWNQWTSNEENFIQTEMWDACMDAENRPILPDKTLVLDVGVDVGIKHDQASVVAVVHDAVKNRVRLARHRTFQPTPEDPIDLEETVEAFLLELHAGYTLRSVHFDPYQFHRSAMTLKKKGLPMVEFAQTPSNLTTMGQNFYELIQYKNLAIYPDDAMRKSAGQAVAVDTPRGWRITKEKSVHKIDVIVALGMAAYGCVGLLGNSLFDADRLAKLRAKATDQARVVRLKENGRDVRVLSDENGHVRLWAEPEPGWRHRYAIGAVVADGTCCAVVFDRAESRIVAEVHSLLDPDEFAKLLKLLHDLYGRAVLVPVISVGMMPVLGQLRGVYLYHKVGRPGAERSDDVGYHLTDSTREELYEGLVSRVQAGVLAPVEFYDEALHVERDVKGDLPADVNPDILRVMATAAAVQGDIQETKVHNLEPKEDRRPTDFQRHKLRNSARKARDWMGRPVKLY